MPADCTAIAPAIDQNTDGLIVTSDTLHHADFWPAPGWTETLRNATAATKQLQCSLRDGESRESFRERMEQRHRAEIIPFATTSWPALNVAMRAAETAVEEMLILNADDSVAQEFDDADVEERNEAWLASLTVYEQKLSEILEVPAATLQIAAEKVQAFLSGRGLRASPDGEVIGPNIGSESVEEAFGALWRDTQALTAQSAAPCPAERLLIEQESLYEAESEENETGVLGPAHRRYREIEEQASWARARSLKGAMYQIGLAIGRLDLMEDETDENRRALDKAHIERLLASALSVVHDLVGGDLPDVINSYSGLRYGYVERLSDDPQPFDAQAFVERYTAAGGSLSVDLDGNGRHALINTCPHDHAAQAQLLRELGDSVKYEAVFVLLRARWGAKVNAENLSPAKLDAASSPITKLEQLLREHSAIYRTMPVETADQQHECEQRIKLTHALHDCTLAAPCDNLASVRAKAQAALDRAHRPGSATWDDNGIVVLLEQIITFLGGEPIQAEEAA